LPIETVLAPNLVSGHQIQKFYGVAESTNNSVVESFSYTSPGSINNALTWDLYGNGNTMAFNGAGVLTVPSITCGGIISQNGSVVNVANKNTNYELLSTDDVVILTSNATITLNSALPKGTNYRIKNSYNSNGYITITPTSGTIDGSSTLVLTLPGQAVDLIWDGTSIWNIF